MRMVTESGSCFGCDWMKEDTVYQVLIHGYHVKAQHSQALALEEREALAGLI